MIQFPETAENEWKAIADQHNAAAELRKRIERDTNVEREVERLRVRHEAAQQFQQELDEEDTPDLEIVSLADYQTGGAVGPADLIEGVMKDDGVCIMLGPSGSGKSTLGLQMAYSLMTGEDWLGQDVQQISGGVGVMSYDMQGAMVLDWMSGFPKVDPDRVSVVNAYKRGNPLNVPLMRQKIVSTWQARAVEVVVIDSFSASFFGADQNDAAAVQQHYRDLIKFALTEVGARALIVIVHSTESNPHKARGSTVHHDVGDTIVSMEGTGNTPRKVRMVKYRQHRGASGHMTHQMNPVVLTTPDDVTHLVSLDPGGMTLAGMTLPPKLSAAAFALPETNEAPDTDSDSGLEGEDDL